MPELTLHTKRQERLPPLQAFWATLLLAVLGWVGIYELIELVRWAWRLATQ